MPRRCKSHGRKLRAALHKVTTSKTLCRYNNVMPIINAILSKYYRLRGLYNKRRRLLFPSPAEVELIRVMGGKVITIDLFKDIMTGFPLTIVVSLGSVFKAEHIEREVRVGRMYVDFGNDIRRGVEVDGKRWHQDVTKELERDEYCAAYGWSLLHIQAIDVYKNPDFVREKVTRFLTL